MRQMTRETCVIDRIDIVVNIIGKIQNSRVKPVSRARELRAKPEPKSMG